MEDGTDMSWNSIYESNDPDVFEQKMYFRTYVTYTNGSDSITVWNAYCAETDTETLLPYIVTSVAKAAEKDGITLPERPLYGDVNNDGTVKEDDLLTFRKYLVDAVTLSNSAAADVVPDCKVDVVDLVRFKRYLADSTVMLGAELKEDYFLENARYICE